TITGTGNVGIGTTTPGSILDIGTSNPTIKASTANTNLAISTNGTGYLYIDTTGAGTVEIASNAAVLNLGNNYTNFSNANPTIYAGTLNTNLAIAGNGTGTVYLDTTGAGNVKIASNAALLTLGKSGGNIALPEFSTAGGVIYTNGAGLLSQTGQGSSSQVLEGNGSGAPQWVNVSSFGGNVGFANIDNGTNTHGAMVVGTGSSLTYSGGTATSGVINANQLLGGTWAIPGTIGSTTPNTITGTTINGTTGINTGAGSGTNRIDSSGNLANIGTLGLSGTITDSGASTGLTFSSSTGPHTIQATSSTLALTATGANIIQFNTNGAEA